MSTGSKHLDAGKAATLRAWVTLVIYVAAGVLLANAGVNLAGDALAYYMIGLAVIGGWAAGGESLVASLSTLRHVGEGLRKGAPVEAEVAESP